MSEVFVLNFSYEPLSIVSLPRAVRLLFAGKAEIVTSHQGNIASPSFEMRLPSIIRMLYYIKRPRARHTCQYCGARGREMTVDHVVPKSRGGPSTWENLATSCQPCNGRKNNRTPDEARMKLRRKPYESRYIPWIRVKRNTVSSEWGKFLFLYDVSIEERAE